MLNRQWLEQTFKVYFDEMQRCVKGKCYWALLHLVLVLPDVCAAMESVNGESDDGRYRNWCKRYLSDEMINPDDWYRMRCVILHQGRTLDEKGKSQYSAFGFSQPNESGGVVHRCIKEEKQGKILQLDVGEMAKTLRAAVDKWFKWLEKNQQPQIVENVARNAVMLARSQDKPSMPILIEMPIVQSFTTSSPWPRS